MHRTLQFAFCFLAQFAPSQPPPVYNLSGNAYAPPYSSSLVSSYINSNNNNNILDVQSLYSSVPLNHFSTNNQFLFASAKHISQVCHTPSSNSSLSSFDELPPPPVKPRLTLRPQLPPPPPPPPLPSSIAPIFSTSIPLWRGPTRPAPKPPVQIKADEQQVGVVMSERARQGRHRSLLDHLPQDR